MCIRESTGDVHSPNQGRMVSSIRTRSSRLLACDGKERDDPALLYVGASRCLEVGRAKDPLLLRRSSVSPGQSAASTIGLAIE